MELDEELRLGLDAALNEADLCDLRIHDRRGEVQLLFQVLTLPPEGPEPEDRRRVLACQGVARLVAALRHEPRPDGRAVVAPLALRELPAVVRSFGCQPVYGWEFFDLAYDPATSWRAVPSIDYSFGKGRGAHSLDLFQQGVGGDRRRLDLRVEFDVLEVTDPSGAEVPLAEFAAGGRRWWAAFSEGDPRTAGHGISRPES